MNEVEYILRIVLKARDELAGALKKAREELRLFANAADSNKAKIDGFNDSIEKMNTNVSNITDKFKEWREVIQGTAGGNDKAKKSFGDLGREVDTANKATQRHTESQVRAARAQDALLKSADKLRNEYRELSKQEQQSDRDRGYTLSRLKFIGAELDRISKKVNDPDIRKFYYNWSQDSKKAADSITADIKRVDAVEAAFIKNEEQRATKRQNIRERDAAARQAFTRAREVTGRIGAGDPSAIDVAEARRTVTVLKQVANQYDDTTRTARNLRGEAENLSNALRSNGRESERTQSIWQRADKALEKHGESAAGLDNILRGTGWLVAAGFSQQLLTALVGLSGAFVSVASSAAQAATAVGGMFVAGVGQALPAIGLLGAALFRVSAIMDVVKQSQLTQKQEAVQGAAASKRVADATDTVRNAQEGLADANRRVQEAQEGLTEARKDAREDLEDLIRAENDAKLAAMGAALSQKEAQEALISAQARGDVEGIQRAQLAVLEAQNDAEESISKKRRARQAAERGRRGGVEGMEGVVQAKNQLEDAERAVQKAGRGIETAKRNAAEAAAGTATAAATLNYLLAQLSPAERRLYTALQNIRQAFEDTYRPITDLIIDSFTRSVEGVQRIMLMPEVIKLARDTAGEIAKQMNRIFDAFTTGPVLDQLIAIGEAGRKNLGPLATIVIRIGRSLVNIAEAAGPSFEKFIGFVGGLVEQFEKLTGDKDKMEDFFNTGEEHLEAWIKLGLAVIQLFLALSGAGGAESGLTTIEDATAAIDDLTKKVNDNKGDVAAFFEDSRKIAYQVVGVIKALAIELEAAFTPERMEAFADLLKDVVIPAIGDVIAVLGGITNFFLDIADHPGGKFLLQMGVSLFLLQKVVGSTIGVLHGFARALAPLFKGLGGIVRIVGNFIRLSGGFGKAIQILRAASVFRFVGFGALAFAIIFLLDKLGLLDDAWREVKSGFNAFWKEVQPSIKKLMDAFSELWDAVSKGKGLFGILASILRPVLKVVIQIGGIFLRVFGRTLGRIVGGVIDVLTGLITFLTGVFTGDWRKAWSGIRGIFRGIFRAIGAVFRALPELLYEIGKKILPALRRGISALWGWLEKLPNRLGNLASDAAKAVVNAFKDVGKTIIKVIGQGLKSGGGIAKDLINGLIDLINDALPNKIKIPGAPDINLKDNPIPRLAAGGPVPGSGRGDRIAALLEPGEHVLTRQEVAAMGGHAAVFALRRALGGGGQGAGGRFADGGAAAGAGSLTITYQAGSLDDFRGAWRAFWNSLLASARNGTNQIETQFREMRVNTARSADRMYRNIRSSLADLQDSFKARGKRIVDSWSDMWQSLKKVTNEGLTYIGRETNKAMKALGEKNIDFGFEAPKKADDGKAGGGFIGGKGHRGRDQGYYALGAGEAVLNWQHQRYVEPAMNAYYGHGLTDMYKRTRGYHAGGPEQPGFAAGGQTEIDATGKWAGNPKLAKVIAQMMKKWKFAITAAGEGGHSSNSDHHWGGALDLVPGAGGSWAMLGQLARAAGWRPNAPMPAGGPFRWIGWNTEAAHGQPPRPNAHLHLSWRRGGPFMGPEGMAALEDIGRVIIKGIEPLKNIAQAAVDLVRKAANKKLGDIEGETAGSQPLGPGGAAEKIFDYFVNRGLSEEIAAGFVGTFKKESNFSTTVGNRAGSGATGLAQWLGGRLTKLQSKPNWQSLQTQLDYVWEELQGSEGAAFAAIKKAKSPAEAARIIDSMYERSDNILQAPEFATEAYQRFASSKDHGRPNRAATGKVPEFDEGGIVPGPLGQAVPIIAHAQEWILNSGQVNRLAGMLGTSRDSLRSMMGFYGGPGGAQGGTEVEAAVVKDLTPAQAKGISIRALRRLILGLQKIGKNIDEAATGIGSVESWSSYIDQTMNRLRRVTRQASRRRVRGQNLERGVTGFINAMEDLIKEGGVFQKLRESIERRTARFARRLITNRFARAGGVVTERLDEAQQARAELREQRRQGRELRGERGDIRGAFRSVQRQLRRRGLSDAVREGLITQRQRLRPLLEEANQRVADNLSAVFEAQQAYLEAQKQAQQDISDAITKRYEDALSGVELFRRIGTALGNEAMIDQVNRAQRDLLTGQMNELQARVAPARAAGAGELADQLQAQVNDLRVQIFEAIQQELRDAAERINTRAQRRLGRLDLGGRMLDAVGAVGLGAAASLAGERFTRAGIFAQRGAALQTQRAGLQGLVGRAAAQGNVGLVQELTDQLAELDVSIKENTKAYFDARVEAVNQRTGLVVSQADLKAQIITLTGEISGNTDTAALLALNTEKANALNAQRVELDRLLNEARLAGNTQAVNDLTTQMLENQLALLQNTQATNELTGNLSKDQGFTSTAWELFSQAIFTGSGGLMPMYQSLFPSAAIGANVINSGMLMAHAGERIVPAKVAALSGGNMGDTNYFDIDINEAGRPIDWGGAATQIMFKKSGAK